VAINNALPVQAACPPAVLGFCAHYAPTFQISAKSENAQLTYSDLSISNFGTTILDLTVSGFKPLRGLSRPTVHQPTKFQWNGQCISTSFPDQFFRMPHEI